MEQPPKPPLKPTRGFAFGKSKGRFLFEDLFGAVEPTRCRQTTPPNGRL